MNYTTDPIDERPDQPAGHVWRATGVVFLVVSLLGLSAGTFWEFFLPAHRTLNITNPPALQMLISAQAIFLIMFWPLLVPRQLSFDGWHLQPERSGGCGCRIGNGANAPTSSASLRFAPLEGATHHAGFLFRGAAEYVIFLVASVPLYIVAAWLSDATMTDVIRSLLYLSAVSAGALGLGLWVRTGRTAIITAVTLAGVLIGLGGPAMYYLLVELTEASGSVDWLWWASPVTCAFDQAGARDPNWYPAPLWAWSLWPVTGVTLFFAFLYRER